MISTRHDEQPLFQFQHQSPRPPSEILMFSSVPSVGSVVDAKPIQRPNTLVSVASRSPPLAVARYASPRCHDNHPRPDLIVLHEHPEWQKPLFAALERRGVPFAAVRRYARGVQQRRAAARRPVLQPGEPQRLSARPHARGAAGARLHAVAGAAGRPGAERRRRLRARAEQERPGDAAAHARHRLPALDHLQRRQRASRLRRQPDPWPALLKPDQGGSGARIQVVESLEAVEEIFSRDPAVWLPDNLFLLQEYLPHDPEQGIVRLEFLGGELLYAMRVKTHGRFNLCPSPVCNPDDGDRHLCACRLTRASMPRRSSSFRFPMCRQRPSRPRGGSCGRPGSTSAGSNIWTPTTAGGCSTTSTRTRTCARRSPRFGFDPFERVVDFLVDHLGRAR